MNLTYKLEYISGVNPKFGYWSYGAKYNKEWSRSKAFKNKPTKEEMEETEKIINEMFKK